jgi:hypothetical protein
MVLNYYALVNNCKVSVEEVHPYAEENKRQVPVMELGVPKEITLAEYDSNTKQFITAHRLKDYRRRTFTLVMLPDVHLPIDDLLEV